MCSSDPKVAISDVLYLTTIKTMYKTFQRGRPIHTIVSYIVFQAQSSFLQGLIDGFNYIAVYTFISV